MEKRLTYPFMREVAERADMAYPHARPWGYVSYVYEKAAFWLAPWPLNWLYRLLPNLLLWDHPVPQKNMGFFTHAIQAPLWRIAWVDPGYLIVGFGDFSLYVFTRSAWIRRIGNSPHDPKARFVWSHVCSYTAMVILP